MEKKTFYIIAGVMTVVLIIAISANAIINLKKREAAESALSAGITPVIKPSATPSPTTAETPIITTATPLPTPTGPLPETFAKTFYEWYVNHPDPLKSGDYQTSGHISEDFIKKIKGFVTRGYTQDPVFTCVGLVPPKSVIYAETTYDKSVNTAIVGLKQNPKDQFLTYKIVMTKQDEKWLVKDVRCAK